MEFHENILTLAVRNSFFRKVVATGQYSQVVLMSLKYGEDIGEEVHGADQIIVIVQGHGTAILASNPRIIKAGDLIFVPAGTQHNFVNKGDGPLKLFTVYAPPQHADKTIHETKKDAQKEEY